MGIKVFNVKQDVNPIGLGLCYSESSKEYVENLLPELITTCEKSFDMYIHPYTTAESTRDVTWCVYAMNKADFIVTNITATNDEEFNDAIAILNSYAKHPSLSNVYMIVDCAEIINNDEYKNIIVSLSHDPNNTVLFMPVSTKEELVNVTMDVVNIISDLSAFNLANADGEDIEVEESEHCECSECCDCDNEEVCECSECDEVTE